jgi:hypothetical protein
MVRLHSQKQSMKERKRVGTKESRKEESEGEKKNQVTRSKLRKNESHESNFFSKTDTFVEIIYLSLCNAIQPINTFQINV